MPQLRFRNFSDLAFIQSIDKPRFLRPLLADYNDYFARQGLDIAKLTNDDDCDRKLLAAFTQADEDMPPALLATLFELDDLADETGHDRILEEARKSGVTLNGIYTDLNPGEFIIAVQRDHKQLVRFCHDMTAYRKTKVYQEYQAKGDRKLSLKRAKALCPELKEEIAPWFEANGRSRACELYFYKEKDDFKFLVTHGKLIRTDGTIDKSLKRSRIAYRPQKHDSMIFNTEKQRLKINAQTLGEKKLYREKFGKVFFGDADYFPEGAIYTLEPLKDGEEAIKLVPGMESRRLVEVSIDSNNNHGHSSIHKAEDIYANIRDDNEPNWLKGKITRAKFKIKYSSGGRARKLEIREPNVAEYDTDRDGPVAEAFLTVNRFFVGYNDE